MRQLISAVALGVLAFSSTTMPFVVAKDDISPGRLVGEYSYSCGMDARITPIIISQNSDQTFRVEIGHSYYVAAMKEDILELYPAQATSLPDYKSRFDPIKFYPVLWGERTYLVRPNLMSEFCKWVNVGAEPSAATYSGTDIYLKQAGWTPNPIGLPNVPTEFKKLLLAKPVSGKVTELVGNEKAWVDVGSESGICAGMSLITHLAPDQVPTFKKRPGGLEPRALLATVLSAEKDRCTISGAYLRIGTVVTSRRGN